MPTIKNCTISTRVFAKDAKFTKTTTKIEVARAEISYA